MLRTIDDEYDVADRLIEEDISDLALGNRTITYAYDPVGNRLTKTECTDARPCVSTEYSYDDNDRLLTESGYAYSYDNNGNMLTKSGNGEQWQLAYNALNQLTRANISGPQGASVIDYAYDHDGIRIGKTVNGTDITKYVVDKNRPYARVLEEEHLSGGLSAVTSYVYGDALISSTIDGTLTQYYHTDGMGSVRGLSDSSGVMAGQYSYDAYGLLLDSNGASANPYRYRGEQYDSDLESYYLRARYYQPGTGRFLTTDPFEGVPTKPMTQHRYLYGNNDPLNVLDPSGKMSLTETLVTTGIIGNLSMMYVGTYTTWGQYFVAELARNVYPEAYIIGLNVTGTVPPPFSWMLQELSYEFNDLWPSPPTVDCSSILDAPYLHGTVGGGREYLLSVGSGEMALFNTRTLGGTLSLPTFSFGVELYDGFVYNLWSADDYTGPFGSISLNWGKNKPGLTLFGDAARGFTGGANGNGGPWGGASSILSESGLISWDYGMTWSNVNYTPVKEPDEMNRAEVVSLICRTIFATKAIKAMAEMSVASAAFSVLEVTTWMNIGIAHNAWNQHEPEYNILRRREYSRPDGYHSGPYHWLF